MSVDHAKNGLRYIDGAKKNGERPAQPFRPRRVWISTRGVAALGAELPLQVVLLIGCALLLGLPSLTWPLDSADESILPVYAEQVRIGLVPHRDFFTVYGPAPYYAIAGLFSIFGSSVLVERLFGVALHLAVALGCFMLGWRRGRAVALLAGFAALIILSPLGAVPHAWLGAMGCLTCSLGLLSLSGRWPLPALAGVMAALSMSFRPELVVVVVPVMVLRLWRTQAWLPFLPGFVAGLAPLGLVISLAGTRLWHNVVVGRIGVNGSANLADNVGPTLAILAPLIVLTTVLVTLGAKRRDPESLSYAALSIGLAPQALQRLDPVHVIYVLCVTAPLVFIGVSGGDASLERARRMRRVAVALVVAAIAGVATMSFAPREATSLVRAGDRTAYLPTAAVETLANTRNELLKHAPPGGVLFVGSTDMSRMSLARTEVYFLVPELRARAYFLELGVGVSERAGSGLVEDIRGADVLLLSPMSNDLRQALYPNVRPGSPEANEVVRHEFCLVAQTGWGYVYEHRACPGGTELAGVQPVES